MFEEKPARTKGGSPVLSPLSGPLPLLSPRIQRQAQAQQQLVTHTRRPTAFQRQQASTMFQALNLQREAAQELELQRNVIQAEAGPLPVSAKAVEAALQRQAARTAPVGALRQAPATPGQWVQAARLEVQRVQDPSAPNQTRWLGAADRARHVGILRSIGHGLAQGFKTDRGPATQRYAEYGDGLATLQRQALTGSVPRMVLALTSPAERPLLQRAIDEALQRQQAEEARDEAVLHLHGLQRQLADLDHQAQPIMERLQARRGSGMPLPAAVQRQLEASLNHDLSGVRVHADTEADLLSKKVNAVAFTTGQDIYFQSGKFDPNSQTGIELLAHEATHTVQQSKGQVGKGIDPDAGLEAEARQMGARIAAIQPSSGRSGRPAVRHRTGVSATFTPSTTVQRKEGASSTTASPVLTVGKLGVIKQADGANVHISPDPRSGLVAPQPVALGTRVGVISQTADGWSRISLSSGKSGYVQTTRVTTDLPDPGARLIRVTGGQTAIGVAERYYQGLVKPGQDLRYYVNVLEYVDRQRSTGAFQGGQTLKAGTVLWIPGPQMAQSLVGQVGSGSITGGRWAETKNAVGNGPGANILRSVMESPQYIGEVLGETWKTVKEHWPVLLATTVAMVGAEFLVGALAAVPEPTMLTKVLAVGLQGMITAIAGGFAIAAGYAAIKAGQRWLTLAWTAKGDVGKLKAASKAFLGMIGDLVLLVASAAGVKTSAQKTAMFAKAPVKGMNVAAPTRALTAARAGPALPKTANPTNDFLYNKYWKNLHERTFAESPAEIARLRKALPPLKNLSDSEIIAIRQYTTRAYVPLNGALRAGTDAAELSKTNSFISTRFNMPTVTTADADVLAQEILVGLGKLPAYGGKAYRGEGLERLPIFQAMKPGDVWVEKAFLSSAYSPAGAMQKEMTFSLTSKSGVVIDEVSVVPHELEVLFKPGTKFKLVSIGQDKMTGKWEIVAEEQ